MELEPKDTVRLKLSKRGQPNKRVQYLQGRVVDLSYKVCYDILRNKDIPQLSKVPIALTIVKTRMTSELKSVELDHTAQLFLDVLDKVGQINSPDCIDVTPDSAPLE